MTNLQEAKLAREAELCFATLALATDYDCWHAGDDDVAIDDILRVLAANVDARAQHGGADVVPTLAARHRVRLRPRAGARHHHRPRHDPGAA